METQKPSFFDQVYAVVRQIPEGRITSYGAIARYLGSPQSARMVGWAMNASHTSNPPVPAQRVVNRNGILTGKNFFSHPLEMQIRLENEGIKVIDDKIQNFKEIFWDPNEELKL